MQYVEFIVTRPSTGAALPNGKVTVYLAATTTLATLFNAAGAGISNPVTADTNGLIGFAAANGSYDFSTASADGSYVVPTIHRQQFYDLSALDAQVTAATAAATTAQAQVPLVNAAGATQVTAVNAAAASGLTNLSSALPIHDNIVVNATVQPFPFSGPARNADGTVTLISDARWYLGATQGGCFPPTIRTAIAAGKAITFLLPCLSGTISSTYITESPSGTVTSLTLSDGAYRANKVLASDTTFITLYASSGTGVVTDPAMFSGAPARARTDPALLAAEGYEVTKANRAAGTPVSFTKGYTGDVFVLPVSAVNQQTSFILMPRAFALGEVFTFYFTCNLPMQGGTQQFTIFPSFGPSQATSIPFILEQISATRYRMVITATPATAGKIIQSIDVQRLNSAGPVLQLSDPALYRGDVYPVQTEASPVVKSYTTVTVQADTALNTYVKRAWIWSDSSKDPDRSIGTGYPLDYWMRDLAGSRLRFTNLATAGANAPEFLGQAELLPCTVNVVGGVIPADQSEFEITSWSVVPMTGSGMTNRQQTREFSLDGVDCVFTTSSTFDASIGVHPVRLFAKAVNNLAVPRAIANGTRLVLKQGRQSASDFVFISTGSVNGGNPGGAIDVYNAVLANRCVGLTSTEIARVMARYAFCIELAGAQTSVPATQNTDKSGSAPYTGFPAGTVWDMNAPQGSAGTGTGGGANQEYLSAGEKAYLVATGLYTLPTGGGTNDLIQKKGYRSPDFAEGDSYHPNPAMQALMGYRHFYSPQFRAWWQA